MFGLFKKQSEVENFERDTDFNEGMASIIQYKRSKKIPNMAKPNKF